MRKKIFYAHLILGLSFSVFLSIIGISGAILSFENEILSLLNSKKLAKNSNLAAENIFKNINGDILMLKFYPNNSLPIEIYKKPSEKKSKFQKLILEPNTGQITPFKPKGDEFFRFMRNLHKKLLSGNLGKQIVGFSTICLILISISGLILYSKLIRRNFKKSLKLNFKQKGRNFLYNIHSVIGVWTLIIILIISLTGLYWSYPTYRNFLYNIFVDKNKLHLVKKRKNSNFLTKEEIIKSYNIFQNTIKNDFDVAYLRAIKPNQTEIRYIKNSHERAYNTLWINLINNNTEISLFKGKSFGEQIMQSMLPLHSGSYFGILGKVIFFISSLSVFLFSVTGIMLFIQRKLKKPKKEKNAKVFISNAYISSKFKLRGRTKSA